MEKQDALDAVFLYLFFLVTNKCKKTLDKSDVLCNNRKVSNCQYKIITRFHKRVRRCIECSEHISLRNARERWSMALEREWLLQTVEKFSREDAQRAELVSHTKIEFIGGGNIRNVFSRPPFCHICAIFSKSDLRRSPLGCIRRFLLE